MITANELRIGNLIRWEDPSNDIVQITGIHKVKGLSDVGYFIDYKETSRNKKGCAVLDEFIPVELTPELLKKAGFNNCSCGGFKNDGLHIGKDDLGRIYYKGVTLIHLHQLQNLYFALTEEELEVNLTKAIA